MNSLPDRPAASGPDAPQRFAGAAPHAPHPCGPVDATGAGDTFGGALVARLVAGDAPGVAGRYAAVAASLSTQGFGAVEPIPRAEVVRAHLARPADGAASVGNRGSGSER